MKMWKPARHAGNYSKIRDTWQHMDYPVRKVNGQWIVGNSTPLQHFILLQGAVDLFETSFFERLEYKSYVEQDGRQFDAKYMFMRTQLALRQGDFIMRILVITTDGIDYDFPEL